MAVSSLSLVFPVPLQEVDEGHDFRLMDVCLQEFAVVVDEGGHRVFGSNVVPNLALHHGEELIRYVFLQERQRDREKQTGTDRDREMETETDRKMETETNKQTEREMETKTKRETKTERVMDKQKVGEMKDKRIINNVY